MGCMTTSLWPRLGMVAILGLLSVMPQQTLAGGIEVAEGLLVDLRAEDLEPGSVSEWPNHGSLGGVFTAVGNPVLMDVGGWESVSLDGGSYFDGPTSVPGVEGGGTRTIEVWAYKAGGVSGEKTMVSWAHRGGPEGTNMSFGYATDPTWGAVGQWGAGPDMGWGGAHAPQPAEETWWYLVYTHDGATSRLYVNGDPAGEESMTLNTHGGSIIRVGAQGDNTGDNVFATANFIGAIAQVRIHDGVLTPEQIQQNALIPIQSASEASNPSPEDGEEDVLRNTQLSWTPGDTSVSRHVYFGTSLADVQDATVSTPLGVLQSTGQDANTYDPGRFEFDAVYYWRVDEVNGTPDNTVFQGEVWSFTAEPFSVQIPGAAISVSASSYNANGDPNFLIDGSGLTGDTHGTANLTGWLSTPTDMQPSLVFELSKPQMLDRMLVWNSNTTMEPFFGMGAKDITLETSMDGETWTVVEGVTSLTKAPGHDLYNTPDSLALNGVLATQVRIQISHNWGGLPIGTGLAEVQFYAVPTRARTPYPADQAVDVLPDVIATWRAGRGAGTHRVLVSQDVNAVAGGVSALANTHSVDMSGLDLLLGETYYWQVVEVNENNDPSEWASDVWSLTTVNRVKVDDFESYDNFSPDRPFQSWLDGIGYSPDEFFAVGYNGNGSGAAVGHDIWSVASPYFEGDIMEQVLTAEGSGQSMPIYYSGNSTTDRTFEAAQDWSQAGIKTLVLYFNGDRANDAASLYITINGQRVNYPNSAALSSGVWTQWHVELASVGPNLSQVNNMSIGIDSSGSGVVLVDQISLYRNAPDVPVSRDPGTDGLAAQYSFENDYTDSSGHGLTGTPMGIPVFEDGLAGHGLAVTLNGTDDYIELPIGTLISTLKDCTFAMWANFSGQGGNWQRLLDFGSGTSQYVLISPSSGGGVLLMEMNGPGAGTSQLAAPMPLPTGWHHVAGVIDSTRMEMILYLDGAVVAQGPTDSLPADAGETTQNWLGRSQYPDPYYDGSLDEFRVYDRVLSEGEVRYLAGDR